MAAPAALLPKTGPSPDPTPKAPAPAPEPVAIPAYLRARLKDLESGRQGDAAATEPAPQPWVLVEARWPPGASAMTPTSAASQPASGPEPADRTTAAAAPAGTAPDSNQSPAPDPGRPKAQTPPPPSPARKASPPRPAESQNRPADDAAAGTGPEAALQGKEPDRRAAAEMIAPEAEEASPAAVTDFADGPAPDELTSATDLRNQITARAAALPAPRLSGGRGGAMVDAAQRRRGEIHFTEPAIADSARAQVPPVPAECQVPPEPTAEDPVPGATQRLEATAGRSLAPHRFASLSTTPLGNAPRLGDRPQSADRIREAHPILEQGPPAATANDPRQPLLDLRTAMLNPPPVPAAQAGAATVAPQPPRPVPTPTATTRTQLPEVFARILARPENEAREFLSRARQVAFPGGALDREIPGYGDAPLAADLARELATQYRDIATQAGVAAADLDRAVAQRQRQLQDQELAARTDVSTSGSAANSLVCEAHEQLASTIATEARRIDATADAVASRTGAGNPAETIHRRRDKLIQRVTRRAGEIDAAYRHAREDGDRALDQAQTQRVDAYRAAAQVDEFQINEMAALPPERQSRLRAIYTEQARTPPTGETGLTQVEINVLAAASQRWADQQAVAVRSEVRGFKTRAGTDTGDWQADTAAAADAARGDIRAWDEQQTGETLSWWDQLWAWVDDWTAQARANADAWLAQQNQQHAAETVADLNLLDRLGQAAEQGITEHQQQELNSLTGEQGQIVQQFFQARSEGRAVDPVSLVADLTRARVFGERRQSLVQQLEDKFLADPDIPFDQIDRIVGRAVSGLAGQLNAAFHGNWGLLSEAGTDEEAVYAALDGLNRVQSLALRNVYQRRYGVSLDTELQNEMEGGERDRARALLSGNRAEAAAARLFSAMHETVLGTGLGTDEQTIHDTLRGLSAEERAEVVRIYRERYHLDLATDLTDELDDWATLGQRGAEQAQAELAGELERADALEIEEELQGSWFHTSTTTTVASVYERVRREVQAQADRESRDSAWMEAEITRRTSGIRGQYDQRNAASGATLASDIEAATLAERNFWGTTTANREASRDYLAALSRNDMATADAARIRIERTSLTYASDSAITGTLSSQYDRALAAERLDYAPERRRALLADLDARERAEGRVWTAAERWAAQQEVDRQVERELIDRARTTATDTLRRMEQEYSSRYHESAETAILDSTSGVDHDMAATQLSQGGYLDPYQTFDFATRRVDTDEEAAVRAFAGLTEAQIQKLDQRWRRDHEGESLLQRARSELSGRDLLNVEIALEGAPQSIDAQIAQMRRRVAFEQPTNAIGAMLAVTERQTLEAQLAHLEALADRMRQTPAGSTPEEQRRARDGLLGEFDTQTSLVQASIEQHRQRGDALADSVTTAVGMAVAIVVGAVGSILTGGAAGAVALAVIASLASTAATIGTRALLKGSAYGWEDLAVDIGVGLVDAVVAALTAGLGDKLLGAAKPAGQAAVRSATATGMRGAWQRAVGALQRSAARLVETGVATRGVRPVGFLSRMASQEASLLSRGAAHAMAQTAENFVQSLPSTALSVALDDNTWKGSGNPVLNFLSGTAQGLGPGLVMGLAMSGAQAGAGHVAGLPRGPHLGAETHLRAPERPAAGTRDYHARLAEWQTTHPGRPEADFQAHLDSEFETANRAFEAQRAARQEVATHLEEALPPADRSLAAEIPVTVVNDLEFRSLNAWRAGDATVVVRDGQVHIVVREGAPPHAVRAQLETHVERLRNLVEPGTGGRVRDPRAALPRDLRGRMAVVVDPDLPPRTVRVEHTPVPRIVAGPGARAADLRLHVETARNVLQLHGAYGRVRHLLDRFADWAFLHGEPPSGTRAWEARQELRKLPDIIEARMREAVHPDLTPHQRAAIEADIAHLREQIAVHRQTLADLDLEPGRGYIAAEGRAVPTRADLDAAHQRWLDELRAAIRGEGPEPPRWRGKEPKLDEQGTWRGRDPAEAYAAYRAALRDGGGRYEAIIVRDRLSGEYVVMLGRQGSVAAPAASTGRSWETVMHFHPNAEGALRYTLPAQQDLWLALTARFADGHPAGAPHVEFIESVINGQPTRVAVVVDATGMRLEIGRGAAGTAGPVAVSEVVPIRSLDDYLNWWRSQDGGTPQPRPTDPGDTRWVPPGSQEYRDLVHASAEALGHGDLAARIDATAPERAGVPEAPRTMAGSVSGSLASSPEGRPRTEATAAPVTARDPGASPETRAGSPSPVAEPRTPAMIASDLLGVETRLLQERAKLAAAEAKWQDRYDQQTTTAGRERVRQENAAKRAAARERIDQLQAHRSALRQEARGPREAERKLVGEVNAQTPQGREGHLRSAAERLDAARSRADAAQARIDAARARLPDLEARRHAAGEDYRTAPDAERAAKDLERRRLAHELAQTRKEIGRAREEQRLARAEAETAQATLNQLLDLNEQIARLDAEIARIHGDHGNRTPITSHPDHASLERLREDRALLKRSMRQHIAIAEGLLDWRMHEDAVADGLRQANPGRRVVEQAHLEITLRDGSIVQIIPDALVEMPDGRFRIVDAKFSESAAIAGGANASYTPGQRQAYPEIARGEIIHARISTDSSADQLGLDAGEAIDLDPRIEIHTNRRDGTIRVLPYRP